MTKDLKQIKQELIQKVQQRTEFIVNDIHSFIYSKIKQADDNRSYINAIGGGNFLCTLGIFSVLNLLAKINSILNGKECKKVNSRCDIYSKDKKVTEKDCFVELYKDTKSLIKWGLKDKEEVKSFWNNYRNSLSHITVPQDGVAAYSPKQLKGIDFDTLIIALKQDNRDIYGLNGINDNQQKCLAIAVEVFNEKLTTISDFIKNKLNQCNDKKVLNNIKEFLR